MPLFSRLGIQLPSVLSLIPVQHNTPPLSICFLLVLIKMVVDISFKNSALLLFAGTTVYTIALAIHRLFFHKLSSFPGPRLAAATHWYAAYFDLVKQPGGHFVF